MTRPAMSKAYPLQDWDSPSNEGAGYRGSIRLNGGASLGEESDDERGARLDELAGVISESVGVDMRKAARIAELCAGYCQTKPEGEAGISPQSIRLLGGMLADMAEDAPLFASPLWVMAAALECDEAVSLRVIARKLGVSHECVAKRIAKFRARYNLPPSRLSRRETRQNLPTENADKTRANRKEISRVLPKDLRQR